MLACGRSCLFTGLVIEDMDIGKVYLVLGGFSEDFGMLLYPTRKHFVIFYRSGLLPKLIGTENLLVKVVVFAIFRIWPPYWTSLK
jgi:hypothetical protein